MENTTEGGGDVEQIKAESENRKTHIRPSDEDSAIPTKVMKLGEEEDALTNQILEEEEQAAVLANENVEEAENEAVLTNEQGDDLEQDVSLTNDVDSDVDVDLGDDEDYDDDMIDRQEAEPKDMNDEDEQLDLEADLEGEGEDFDEYEDELGTTAEETEDNVQEEEADSSTEMQDFLQANLAYIEDCQSDIDSLNHEANEEILRVEQKYNKLRLPVYKRRNAYIERVPHFWATVFSQHLQLRQVLTKEDVKCLKFVTRLQVEDFEDNRSGYSIQFHFSKNPWFQNEAITKEYHLPWQGSPSCSCTPIHWKNGMDLTQKSSSFFSWFTSQEDASADDIAEIIKDDLWPNPLQCFLMTNKQAGDSDDDADDSGNLNKDDVVLLDESQDDDVEYISSEEDDEEWEAKDSTSAQYVVQEDDDEDPDEEYDDFDDESGGGPVEVGRAEPSVRGKEGQRRTGANDVITLDDSYLESDEEGAEYFDGDLGASDGLDRGERLLDDQGSENEYEGGLGKGGGVNRVDSTHGNEDSRQSNGIVGSSGEDLAQDIQIVTPGVENEPESNSELQAVSKMQEQSKVVSTSTHEGDADIAAGAT